MNAERHADGRRVDPTSGDALARKSAVVAREDPADADAQGLIDELSDALTAITGASGRASFDASEVRGPRACFAVARDAGGRPLGCGALRSLPTPTTGGIDVAEIKRMYARPGTRGIGAALLRFLEAEARGFGYAEVWLETRRVNGRAVAFYERHGYERLANYGRYVGNEAAVCLRKRLRVGGPDGGPG